MINIFLDDEREPLLELYQDYLVNLWVGFGDLYLTEKWDIVKTPKHYKAEIIKLSTTRGKKFPKRISFDNDIQHKIEGYDLLKWTLLHYEDLGLIREFLSECEIKFHTTNSINLPRMQGILRHYIREYLDWM